MDLLIKIFGEGKDLNTLNMCSRAAVIFIAALILIRISGRRSFGLGTPLDNIIVVLLGAILSRAVAGASPFGPTVAASLVIVVIHRVISWATVHHQGFSKLIQGDKILLAKNGKLIKENMDKALLCEEDIRQGLRSVVQSEKLDVTEAIYIERNGSISVIKKEE